MKIQAVLLPILFFLLNMGGAFGQTYTMPNYVQEPDSPHIALIVLSEKWADVREISGEVVKYNVKNYMEKELISTRVSMPYLSNLPVLYIHTFSNKAEAMAYHQQLYKVKPDFMQMKIVDEVWVFSKGNLNTLLLEESIERYKPFFQQHYLEE